MITAKASSNADATLDQLYASWRRMGVNFTGPSLEGAVDLERLIVETAQVADSDERLTICAVSWLAAFHGFVDGRRLSELTREASASTGAYLGAMLSLALEAPAGAGRAPEFETALTHCRPLHRPRVFYRNLDVSPTDKAWMKKRGLPLYRHWGLWHDDMTLKRESLHDLDWLLKVPELRARALCGPSLEASCIALTIDRVTHARGLSQQLGVSYAAVHAAVDRLVGRGLLLRHRNGVRQELRLSQFSTAALTCVA